MMHQPIDPPRRDDGERRESSGFAALRAMFADIHWLGVAVLAASGGIWLYCIITAARHLHEVLG